MPPLLSVAIPTFNRPEKIKHLYDVFLSKLDSNLGNDVEIIICDNSDLEQAEINRKTLAGSNISYRENKTNIGFSGNLIQCLREAEGEFIWVISDDDKIDIDVFFRLIKWLKMTNLTSFNAIMLPFFNFSDDGERYLMNSRESWGGEKGELSEIINKTNKIPFVLFSSVILRNLRHNKAAILENVAVDFEGNDFIQIPLYVLFIGKYGKITYYNEVLQEYKSPDYVRFSLIRMVESMEQALSFIVAFYDISDNQFYKCHYQRWMLWLIRHGAGIIQVEDGDDAKWILIRKWYFLHFKSMKHFKLLCLALLPKFLLKIACPKQ